MLVMLFTISVYSFAENNNTTEVMITNFELQDFTYKSGGAIETMSYKLFMKDIDKYLVR